MANCDSVGFAVEQAKAIAKGLPKPPQKLDASALQYWTAIVQAKRATAWTDSDLLLACQLARDYSQLDEMNDALAIEGFILTRENSGMKYPNPICNLIDKANRRIVINQRALQIHAISTSGKTDHQGTKNEAARELDGKLAAADSDLIPRAQPCH